jgi:hypothetical protein
MLSSAVLIPWLRLAETPLIEGWNGKDWAIMKPAMPKTTTQTGLYAVSCPSPKSCVTVGSGGTTSAGSIGYAEHWNGKNWVLTSGVPWPKGTTDPWLYGVSCPAVGHCVAVGLVGWNPASNAALTGYAAAAIWNGKTWRPTAVAVPGQDMASEFGAVTCRPGKPKFCAAVGAIGPRGTEVTNALSGFWNGGHWNVVLHSSTADRRTDTTRRSVKRLFPSERRVVNPQCGSRISLADQGDLAVAGESCALVEPPGAGLAAARPFVLVRDVAWRP